MLFGLAILIVGVVFKLDWDVIRDAFADESQKVDINLQEAGDYLGHACIIFGAAIFVLAFIGWCGGKYQIKLLLIIYSIVVLIIMVGQIVVVALVVANTADAEKKIKDGLTDALKGYDEDMRDEKSKAWSALFSTLECCGVANRTYDFTAASNFNMSQYRTDTEKTDANPIPIACCKNFNYDTYKAGTNVFQNKNIVKCLEQKSPEHSYTVGCETKVKDVMTGNKNIMIGVGGAVFGIEIIVVMISFFLTCCREEDRYN